RFQRECFLEHARQIRPQTDQTNDPRNRPTTRPPAFPQFVQTREDHNPLWESPVPPRHPTTGIVRSPLASTRCASRPPPADAPLRACLRIERPPFDRRPWPIPASYPRTSAPELWFRWLLFPRHLHFPA